MLKPQPQVPAAGRGRGRPPRSNNTNTSANVRAGTSEPQNTGNSANVCTGTRGARPSQDPAPVPEPEARDDPDDELLGAIDDETSATSTPVSIPYDLASQWVIIQLFEQYFVRLELTSSSAVISNLYKEIKEKYNSNTDTNGPRTLRPIKTKWNEILKKFRRRKEQETQTGTAPQAYWEFHDKLEQIGMSTATVIPPTINTLFMRFGETVDSRANRS